MSPSAASAMPHGWIEPDWPTPAGVRALMTTRAGGVSAPPWGAAPGVGGGLNLALHTGDDPQNVAANRACLRRLLPGEPVWLEQVHGAAVVDAEPAAPTPAADASVALAPGVVCAVLVADCLPVLVAEAGGRAVAAAHAGWRGLAAGVLPATVARLRERLAAQAGVHDAHLIAWLGPAIGARRFEVGADVLAAMRAALPGAERAFASLGGDKYLADLFALARLALARSGVGRVYGGGLCTVSDASRFYSFRRDRCTGRHAALIWREPPPAATAQGGGTAR